MAMWPDTLPSFNMDLQINPVSTVIRTDTSVGPAKVRRRYIANPANFSASWTLKGRTQIAAFETFFETTTAGGSLRFQARDPWSGNIKDFRFLPETLDIRVIGADRDLATHAIVSCVVERL